MSYPIYQVPAGDVLPILFNTFDSNGASITLTGLAVTDIEIYKDGSVTQRASDAGYVLLDTDGIDFDGLTGIHGFSIDTGDNTDAGFYTVGAWFHVVVSAVTIDTRVVSFIAAAFRIMAAEGVAAVPDVNVTHVGDTPQTAGDIINTLAGKASQASVDAVDDFLDTEIAAIKAKTDNLPSDPADASDIAASFAGVNTKLDTIDDFLDTEIAAIKAKTDGLPSDPADASDIAASFAGVNTKLDTIDDFLDAEVAAILADTNELQTDWADGGRLDLILDARASQTSVDTIDDFLDTEIAAIKAKTDGLPSDPADASDIAASFVTVNGKLDTIDDFLDTEVAAIKAKTDGLPSDPADASDVAASFMILNTKLDTIDDFLDTEVAAIKAKTDQLTFSIANKVDSSIQAAGDLVAAVANKIADHVLRRTYANARASADGDAVNFRSLLGAVGKLVNKWAISGSTLTVYQEDDVTSTAPGGTQAITATAGAEPITTLDTN